MSSDAEQDGERSSSSSSSKRHQHCTYCKNHGQHSRKTNHKCQYEGCRCLLCKLTRLSRLVMRHQQRLWRHLKDERWKDEPAEELALSSKLQKCDMCRNHGVLKEKRAHKNTCPYQECSCHLCDLTRKRRNIMRHQQRVRRSQVTSQHREEAFDYVTQTTAELAQMEGELGPSAIPANDCTPSDTPCCSASVIAEGTIQASAATTTATTTTLDPTCSGSTDAGRFFPPTARPPPPTGGVTRVNWWRYSSGDINKVCGIIMKWISPTFL